MYLDSVGQEYGPVPGWTMREWLTLGRFPVGGDLRVRLPEWERHLALHQLYPDLSTAFVLPPAWPDMYVDGRLQGEEGGGAAEELFASRGSLRGRHAHHAGQGAREDAASSRWAGAAALAPTEHGTAVGTVAAVFVGGPAAGCAPGVAEQGLGNAGMLATAPRGSSVPCLGKFVSGNDGSPAPSLPSRSRAAALPQLPRPGSTGAGSGGDTSSGSPPGGSAGRRAESPPPPRPQFLLERLMQEEQLLPPPPPQPSQRELRELLSQPQEGPPLWEEEGEAQPPSPPSGAAGPSLGAALPGAAR